MARALAHVCYRGACTFANVLYSRACALYGRARSRAYIFYGLARALYGPTSALADLSNRMARARSYVFHRRTGTFADTLYSRACAFDRGSGTRTDVLYG